MDPGAVYISAFAAGVLSLLTPCVLPLLPLAIAASGGAQRATALALCAGVAASFAAIAIFIAMTGHTVGLDARWFRGAGAIGLVAFGMLALKAAMQLRTPANLAYVGRAGGRSTVEGDLSAVRGQLLLGALLGVVWAPCAGPTLGKASALAAEGTQLPHVALVLMMFGLGAALPLAAIGAAVRAVRHWRAHPYAPGSGAWTVLGVVLLVLAVAILTRVDRTVHTIYVERAPVWLTDLTTRY